MNGSVKSTILTYVIVCAVALLTVFAATHPAKACTFSVSFVDKDYAEISEVSLAPMSTFADEEVTYAFRVKVAASGAPGNGKVVLKVGGQEVGIVTLLEAEPGAEYRYSELIVMVNNDWKTVDEFDDGQYSDKWDLATCQGIELSDPQPEESTDYDTHASRLKYTTTSMGPMQKWTGDSLGIVTSAYRYVVVRMRVSGGSLATFSWEDSSHNPHYKSFSIQADSNFHTYCIDMSEEEYWTGTIDIVRLQPTYTASVVVEVDYIRIHKTPAVNEGLDIRIIDDFDDESVAGVWSFDGTGSRTESNDTLKYSTTQDNPWQKWCNISDPLDDDYQAPRYSNEGIASSINFNVLSDFRLDRGEWSKIGIFGSRYC